MGGGMVLFVHVSATVQRGSGRGQVHSRGQKNNSFWKSTRTKGGLVQKGKKFVASMGNLWVLGLNMGQFTLGCGSGRVSCDCGEFLGSWVEYGTVDIAMRNIRKGRERARICCDNWKLGTMAENRTVDSGW
ncbi:hypothetical protein P154DRAFT_310230 [Amniculicola lignicola CBS 123094]|uniref:Uncharacterized protein n=1 Tax=Amniculicola lignicola CBS 123094 TaxID=1392246 RepID=A0A6A5WBZ5_9PLEO|nr:hypothetical protein P154DRAFT_310230 [Amniculicola lignicola CBS 123094]